jgi:hypothetical protein
MRVTSSVDARRQLVDALQIDLIGPIGGIGDHAEILPQSPSLRYLTGFLVPTDANEMPRCDPTSNDELDQAAEPAGIDNDDLPEKPASRRSFLPSSVGVSVLVPEILGDVHAAVRLRVRLPVGEFRM